MDCADSVSRVTTVVGQVRVLKNLKGFPLQTSKQWIQSILNGLSHRTGDGSFMSGILGPSLGPGAPGHSSGG